MKNNLLLTSISFFIFWICHIALHISNITSLCNRYHGTFYLDLMPWPYNVFVPQVRTSANVVSVQSIMGNIFGREERGMGRKQISQLPLAMTISYGKPVSLSGNLNSTGCTNYITFALSFCDRKYEHFRHFHV